MIVNKYITLLLYGEISRNRVKVQICIFLNVMCLQINLLRTFNLEMDLIQYALRVLVYFSRFVLQFTSNYKFTSPNKFTV